MKKSSENYARAISPSQVVTYVRFDPDDKYDMKQLDQLLDKGFKIKDSYEERVHIHISEMFV